jgi:hypothetical protein
MAAGPLLVGINACPRLRTFLADLAPQDCRQRRRFGPLRRRRLSGARTFCHRHDRAEVSDCRRFWRIWRRRPVGDADVLGLYAGDACLARGRFGPSRAHLVGDPDRHLDPYVGALRPHGPPLTEGLRHSSGRSRASARSCDSLRDDHNGSDRIATCAGCRRAMAIRRLCRASSDD